MTARAKVPQEAPPLPPPEALLLQIRAAAQDSACSYHGGLLLLCAGIRRLSDGRGRIRCLP